VLLLFAFLGFLSMQVFAQRTVTGTVTGADDGMGLPGVTVLVKGTQVRTITDINGSFTLTAPAEATTVIFEFMGMETQEVAITGDVVNCVMKSSDIALDDVVVTALGVTRDKKSLGYSVQELSGDAVSDVRQSNFVNSLSGKVSGVSIKKSATMGGSANILIRGNTSLTGNNQALFVVDGVPIDNNTNTSSGNVAVGWGGYDYGNAASDINPDDIESISVLKGAAATVLYGSRAANGVVLITTKKGTKKKRHWCHCELWLYDE
jgi:TonB-dependent SusC/RagA subfamily outer membrane receptor